MFPPEHGCWKLPGACLASGHLNLDCLAKLLLCSVCYTKITVFLDKSPCRTIFETEVNVHFLPHPQQPVLASIGDSYLHLFFPPLCWSLNGYFFPSLLVDFLVEQRLVHSESSLFIYFSF